jgi:hypothetical protein
MCCTLPALAPSLKEFAISDLSLCAGARCRLQLFVAVKGQETGNAKFD